MADFKGTGIVFLRSQIKKKNMESEFLSFLSGEEKEVYKKTLNISWVPIELVSRFFVVAAPLLYPGLGEDQALREIGIAMARDNLTGIYKVFVKIVSMEYLMGKSAKLWHTYHSAGEAHIKKISKKEFSFVVDNYVNMPERFAESTCGYLHGSGLLTGVRKMEVKKTPILNGWEWHVKYE